MTVTPIRPQALTAEQFLARAAFARSCNCGTVVTSPLTLAKREDRTALRNSEESVGAVFAKTIEVEAIIYALGLFDSAATCTCPDRPR